MIGRRSYGGTSTYIPLKVNQAGVIPVIFASSLLYIPILIVQFAGNANTGWSAWIQQHMVDGKPIHTVVYFFLIVFFASLLRGHLLQPRGSGRQHEEVWWLHPGHPGWSTYC